MNLLLNIPIEVRLLGVFLLGILLGSLANLAIYRWAWYARSISPWSAPLPNAPERRWTDRVPILGWWGLRREAHLHGPGFWIRPLVLEGCLGLAAAALYWWEIVAQGLYLPPEVVRVSGGLLHLQFAVHLGLIVLMWIASWIDIDEKLIPDEITVRGTLLGLLVAGLLPWSLLPQVDSVVLAPTHAQALELVAPFDRLIPEDQQPAHAFLTAASPNSWPESLEGRPRLFSLALGLGCYGLWCFAILPRPWYRRHGLGRALRICTARMCRACWHPTRLAMVAAGVIGITAAWLVGGQTWMGLLTALIGLIGSGGLIWAVRLIGAATLKKEAMGFGDVLLMMMMGTFLGWQASLVVFFLAPFAGVVVGVVQLVVRREQAIPYGPFLCLAAVFVLVGWEQVWRSMGGVFAVPWLVPVVIAVCLVLMAVLLLLLRIGREAIWGR